jgi:hypothetical protein
MEEKDMMKRKALMVFMIVLMLLGVYNDAAAKEKKKKLTKEEKAAAKLAKQEEKIGKILGTGASWKPAVFKDIRRGMTCGEVKQYFPNVSCGDIIPRSVAGLGSSAAEYKFHFMSDRLYAATIVFGARLFDEKRFTQALYSVVQRKWGPIPQDKVQQPKWTNPDYNDVELTYNKTNWELKVDLPTYDPGETDAASFDEAKISEEIRALLGSKGNYLPTIISQLSGGMTCEQVRGIFPGLEECKTGLSHHFTQSSIEGHPLVAGLHFSFRSDRLDYVNIIFHYQLDRDVFKNAAFAVLSENWGKEVKLNPEQELASVYPRPNGSLTCQFHGNRWELRIGMEGIKGSTAPVASAPAKPVEGLWTLESARQGNKIESMKGGMTRQLEFKDGKVFMKENGKVVMENFYVLSGKDIYFADGKGGKAVKLLGTVISHDGTQLILRFAGQQIDMIFKKTA